MDGSFGREIAKVQAAIIVVALLAAIGLGVAIGFVGPWLVGHVSLTVH